MRIGTAEHGRRRRRFLRLDNGFEYHKSEWLESPADDVPSPTAFLVEQGPGSTLPTHFHTQNEFQVVVGFGKESRDKVGTVPFHTTMVVWDVPPGEPEARYRNLTPRVRELMEKLRGEQAS